MCENRHLAIYSPVHWNAAWDKRRTIVQIENCIIALEFLSWCVVILCEIGEFSTPYPLKPGPDSRSICKFWFIEMKSRRNYLVIKFQWYVNRSQDEGGTIQDDRLTIETDQINTARKWKSFVWTQRLRRGFPLLLRGAWEKFSSITRRNYFHNMTTFYIN